MKTLLLHGGPIYTLDREHPRVEALLVRGERIVAVGSERDVRGSTEGPCEEIALDGRAVIPGLTDAHIHLLWTGLGRMTVDLDGVAVLEESVELGVPDVLTQV